MSRHLSEEEAQERLDKRNAERAERFTPVDFSKTWNNPVKHEWLYEGLLYKGLLHSIAGPAGSGKTFAAMQMVKELTAKGHYVMYIDEEMGSIQFQERMQAMDFTEDQLEYLVYLDSPRIEWMNDTEYLTASRMLSHWDYPFSLVVLDSVSVAMGTSQLEENSNGDVSQIFSQWDLLKKIVTILLIDHTSVKTSVAGKGPRGATAKVDRVDVQLEVTNPQRFNVDTPGGYTLSAPAKDRHGRIKDVPVSISPEADGKLTVTIGGQAGIKLENKALQEAMKQVIAHLEDVDVRQSKNQIRLATGVAKNTLREALDMLTDQGIVNEDTSAGNGRTCPVYYSLKEAA